MVLVLGKLPAGFTGQLTVPLGSAEDPWFDAEVYCSGTLLDATVKNGEITFQTVEANNSGSAQYEIIRVANAIGSLLDLNDQLLTEIPDEEFTVQVQTNAGASAEAVLAAYDANGKMLEMYPVSVKNGYDYAEVTIQNKDGKVEELRVFLLADLVSGQPLCGNLIFPNP